MKGDVDSATQAIMLTVTMIIIILVASGLVLVLNLRSILGFGGQIRQEYEIVGILNRPYSILDGITSFRPNDRSFMENALESSITGSLPRSDSRGIEAPLKDFIEFYGMKFYKLSLEKGDAVLLEISSLVRACGELKGICTSTGNPGNICGEGRRPLLDNTCGSGSVCCSIEISQTAKKCGSSLEGVCTSFEISSSAPFSIPVSPCGQGREQAEGECDSGKICCRYVRDTGTASNAELPLIYKGQKTGSVKVGAGI